MSTLIERLGEDLKDAMRAGDAQRRDELRGLLAALKAARQEKLTRELDKRGLLLRGENQVPTAAQQADIEKLRSELELTDLDETAVLQQRVKQHRQSIEGFEKGNRPDLVAIEQGQLSVLERYLPQQVTDDELESAIRDAIAETGATGPRDQGKVMGLLAQRLRGRADMRHASERVQALLTTAGA